MSQANPAPSQPDPLPSTSVNPEGKASTLGMVAQDKQFQSLRSRDGKENCQNQGKANKEEADGEELSTKGTLLSQDVRADGWCLEGDSVVSVEDGLEHPGDEASHVSVSGSLRSGNFERIPRNVADCKHGDIQDLEEVQENLRDTHICDNRGPAAGEPVIRKEDDQRDGQTKEGRCKSVNVGVSERSGQSPKEAGGQKPAVAVPPNENIRVGDGGGEKGGGKGEGGGEKGGGKEGGGGDSKKELEASMFPMQSSDGSQQTFSQENSNKQSSDNARSLQSSHSDPTMATPRDSPPSSLKVSRSQSLQNSHRNEHYDLLLIYTKQDESTCANKFREYAASKDWIVTSLAELPIGTLSLKNFRKAMECCSYVVLLISSHFTSDNACERHYNTAILYGDRHPEFADCVLPIIFDSAELPPELDAIQHVEWGGQFFDNVMTRSVDVQKRLDRELREAAAARSSTPTRAMSVDAGIPTTSSYQMASTPPTLSTVPARMPMLETESYQTGAPAQQPPVQRVPEQEACLMPSDNQSPVLPPIPVAGTSDVGATQISLPGVAATTAGIQAQHAATCGTHLITAPGAGHHTPHMVDHSSMPPHQSLAPTTHQPHAAYRQQVSVPAMQYQPSQHPEAVAGMSQLSGGAMAQHGSHIVRAQSLTNPLPATFQHQSLYQQQSSVAAMQYQPLQYPDVGGYGSQHPISMAAASGFPIIPQQFQRTISHPAQDYENLSCEEILQSLSPELNPGQAASQMLSVTRFSKICELLDPVDVRGNDWRFLAEILDLSNSHIRYLEENRTGVTRKLLEVFFLKNGTKEMTFLDTVGSGFRKCGLQLVLFFYVAGLTLQFPIWQNMIINRLCLERYRTDVCDNLSKNPEAESDVQTVSSNLLTLQSIFTDVPGAIAALLLGALSDKIGRKRVLMVPCCGSLVLSLILVVQSIIPVVSLPLVIMSCLIFGVSGGIQTFMTTAVNIITDNTPVEKRAVRISRTMPFFGLGMIVGMLSSGILPQFLSITQVYLLFAASQFIVVVIVYFFIDETLPKDEAASSNDGVVKEIKARKNSRLGVVMDSIELVWNSLTSGIQILTSKENRQFRTTLIVVLVTGMIGNASARVEFNLLLLYTKRAPFAWSPKLFGIFSAFKSLMGIIGQAVGTGVVLGLLGERSLKNDFRLLQFGSISAILICLFTAYATSTKLMMFAAIFVLIGAPSRSANGSIVSRLVSPSKKGAFMSLGSFLNTLTTPILGGIYNGIYASSVDTRPGLVFVSMAVVHAFAFFAVRYALTKTPDSNSISEKTN